MIQKDLENLNVAAANLNEQRAASYALVKVIEDKLANISPGVAARVQTPKIISRNTPDDAIIYLEYGKSHGTWGLYIFHVAITYPFIDAPARIRTKAVSLIPALLEELIKNTQRELKHVEEANDYLKEVVKGMTE